MRPEPGGRILRLGSQERELLVQLKHIINRGVTVRENRVDGGRNEPRVW